MSPLVDWYFLLLPFVRNTGLGCEQQLWNDDQGFFKVTCSLSGDFVVIVRFKGRNGEAATGPEGVLFRYCNHTCFLPAGDQVNLSKSKVRSSPYAHKFLFVATCRSKYFVCSSQGVLGWMCCAASSERWRAEVYLCLGRLPRFPGALDRDGFGRALRSFCCSSVGWWLV